MTPSPLIARIAGATALLALAVAVLGAYVRLNHAGLGCPDWPVCYGRLTWPTAAEDVAAANLAFPERPVETGKAWREQVHRHAAALLGCLVAGLALLLNKGHRRRLVRICAALGAAALAIVAYAGSLPLLGGALAAVAIGLPLVSALHGPHPAGRLACGLLALVVLQAMLGLWTVTLLLKPLVVTAHLLGGFATVTLLACLATLGRLPQLEAVAGLRPLAWLALALTLGQVFLGGWTSSNYAALACPDFPTCQGRWLPPVDVGDAFVLWRGLGVDYEGGVLDGPARTAIHLAHRLGAMIVAVVLLTLVIRLLARGVRRHALAVGALLAVQLALGVWNVVGGLPLWVATAHNGVAALLVVSLTLLLVRLASSAIEAPAAGRPVPVVAR